MGTMQLKWLACAMVFAPGIAFAQSYPSKPLRMIVPFVPGGGADAAARLFGAKLSDALGQQVVIDNRGGAGGTIGAEIAAKSPADGYHLLMGTANLAMNVSLYGKRGYDPIKDFATVSLLSSTPNVVIKTFTYHGNRDM